MMFLIRNSTSILTHTYQAKNIGGPNTKQKTAVNEDNDDVMKFFTRLYV